MGVCQDAHGILSADKPNHTRLRRVLGPAFSERSIKEQDGCVIKYADLLMRKLHARAGEGPLDVNGYFTWVSTQLFGMMSLMGILYPLREADQSGIGYARPDRRFDLWSAG